MPFLICAKFSFVKISALKLKSKNLEKQRLFYSNTLGFEVLESNPEAFTIKAGASTLTFEATTGEQYYHFAFNIPSFQIQEALDWTKKRVNILPYEGQEIIDFINWNAEAFYFFDEDQNIVEFIGRKNLSYPSDPNFSAQSILEISEVGLPSPHVGAAFQQLNRETGILKHSGDDERFCAAGDEHGLFIIVNETEKKWLPTEILAKAFPFELEFEVADKPYVIEQQKEDLLLFQRESL